MRLGNLQLREVYLAHNFRNRKSKAALKGPHKTPLQWAQVQQGLPGDTGNQSREAPVLLFHNNNLLL